MQIVQKKRAQLRLFEQFSSSDRPGVGDEARGKDMVCRIGGNVWGHIRANT